MSEDRARQRFMVMQAARLLGIVLALLGVLTVAGRTGLPREAGLLLFLAGLGASFAVPKALARRWRTPPR